MRELAEIMGTQKRMVEWAQAVKNNEANVLLELSAEDKMICSEMDIVAKEIADNKRPARELSAYIQRVVQPEVYDAPQELLNLFFDQGGTIGEFDDWTIDKAPKNTLQAYESARNGNVRMSYVDFEEIKPVTKNLQIETEVKMEDLRKGGFKTIANLTMMAVREFRNKMFFMMFDTIDKTITGGSQVGSVAGKVTEAILDPAVKYLRGRRMGELTFLSNSDIAFDISKLPSAVQFYSESMKNDLNMDGVIPKYNGVTVREVMASHETGNGEKLINPARLYGTAGKIGEMALKGRLRVYETVDNNNETIKLKLTGYQFTYAIVYPERVYKISIT